MEFARIVSAVASGKGGGKGKGNPASCLARGERTGLRSGVEVEGYEGGLR